MAGETGLLKVLETFLDGFGADCETDFQVFTEVRFQVKTWVYGCILEEEL